MPLVAAGQTNIPVDDLLNHAQRISNESNTLSSQLDSVYSACVRPPDFAGNAAQAYDEFMVKWKASQTSLLENMNGAATILRRLADVTQQNNLQAASSMNV